MAWGKEAPPLRLHRVTSMVMVNGIMRTAACACLVCGLGVLHEAASSIVFITVS